MLTVNSLKQLWSRKENRFFVEELYYQTGVKVCLVLIDVNEIFILINIKIVIQGKSKDFPQYFSRELSKIWLVFI